MKAVLLAAGLGTRLRPLTNTVPKCLVPIGGQPLLSWWMKLLAECGVTNVLINTHHLVDKVRTYIKEFNASEKSIRLTEFFEPELLGSGGTVAANRDWLQDERDFLICYADNLTSFDLKKLVAAHRTAKEKNPSTALTMALFRSPNPRSCGIAALDDANKVISFVEKPKNPASDLANAGIYVAGPEIFGFLPSDVFLDFGHDVLPQLIGRMYGCELEGYLTDIGTPENYIRAKEEWQYDYYQDTITD